MPRQRPRRIVGRAGRAGRAARVTRVAGLAAAALALLPGCTDSAAPARQALATIGSTLGAFGGEAAALEPDGYAAVERDLGALRARYDRGEFRGVVTDAPALQAAVTALRARVAADKAAALAAQNAAWSRYAGTLPDQLAAIERRLDGLTAAGRRQRPDVDVASSQRDVRTAVALWSKGQSAFAAGNIAEALQAARDVQQRADALQASLR